MFNDNIIFITNIIQNYYYNIYVQYGKLGNK